MDITKTIILVRHGSTVHNDNDVWQGRSDSSLNDKGRKEAELLAEELKNEAFDIVFHSPMKRARETAEIIAKNHNALFKAIDCFVEIDVGDFDGAKNTDIIEQHPEVYRNWIMDIDCAMPAGESFNDVFQRVQPGVEEIMESPYRNILIVGHAMVNRAILGQLLHMGPIPARKFRMENCAYSKFYVYDTPHGRHIAVDAWNSRAHLKNEAHGKHEKHEKKRNDKE
ncbi:MAG TPA: histidine phosphatase family protein [Candidatus Deferrimicrobium sp.]|nr:histidine phosphatase family protein [Candidatus Deferrimicrobium sp.]